MSDNSVHGSALVADPQPQVVLGLPVEFRQAPNMPMMTWSSFVPETPAEQHALFTALNGGGLPFSEHVNAELALVNLAMQRKEIADRETGELRNANITSLFCVDGTVYTGESSYIARSVLNLLDSGWRPPFDPPLKVKIVQIKTKRGHMLRLDVLSPGVHVESHVKNEPKPASKPRA